ncbi:MAG TPA: hypothetical protein VEK34_02795 [Methylocella sp.]|nr:hypothetical protein [Methylocella sp.]
MDVTEAVSTAKQYTLRLLEDEKISYLGLEEAFFDESQGVWHITLGFSRPWDNPQDIFQTIAGKAALPRRSYKVIEISDKENKVISFKNYKLSNND